jgi:hypothetical protein
MLKFALFLSIIYTSHTLPLLSTSNKTESLDSSSSGKLTPLEKTCNNITACIDCNKNKCYNYDEHAKSCNKVGERKDTILLLHIFLGYLGVAEFVVGNILIGSIQLGLLLSPCIWACCYACPYDKKGEVNDCLAKSFSCVSYSGGIGLWIWYLVLIIEDKIMNSNGCPLIT